MNELFIAAQILVSVCGSLGFLLVTQESLKLQKLGVVCGLLANPGWWCIVFLTEQWISIPVHLLYTYGWLSKGYRLWSK